MAEFRWTFEVASDESFDRLAAVVAELRTAKLSDEWWDSNYWYALFAGVEVAWGVTGLVDCFEDGEFVLAGLRRDRDADGLGADGLAPPLDYGYLEFEPLACPYSGDCMGQLIEAFGHRVVGSGPA